MKTNYDKFREMLPAVAGILDLSEAVSDPEAVKTWDMKRSSMVHTQEICF